MTSISPALLLTFYSETSNWYILVQSLREISKLLTGNSLFVYNMRDEKALKLLLSMVNVSQILAAYFFIVTFFSNYILKLISFVSRHHQVFRDHNFKFFLEEPKIRSRKNELFFGRLPKRRKLFGAANFARMEIAATAISIPGIKAVKL